MKLREEEFYYQYHQHGGTTIIPTEIFNELYDDATEEIERLKQGYCELKEKCNKGECDCTHEEYNNMCEQNIKMDLEIERQKEIIRQLDIKNLELTTIIKEVRECIKAEKVIKEGNTLEQIVKYERNLLEILDKVLKGVNNEQ